MKDISQTDHVLALETAALAEPRMDELVMDLSRVRFLDAAGVGALITVRAQADPAEKRLGLRGATPPMSKLLTITDLEGPFSLTTGDSGHCRRTITSQQRTCNV